MIISRDEILHGNIFKGLIKLALPLMVLNIINTLYGFVDTYFVSGIGELQVGAVSLVSPISSCGVAFSTGLSAAGVALISRCLGKGQDDKANKFASHLIVLAIILGLSISLICILLHKPILSWLNTPADIYLDTRGYFIGISFDYTCLFILSMYQAIRQASGDSKAGVRLNIIASILNCLLDPLFIYAFKMGTFGAAIATVLSKVFVCPLALINLLNKKETIHINLKNMKLDMEMMKNIITIAIPASLGQLLSSFGFVLMSKEIVSYGSIVMSGYGIGNQVSSIFYIPTNSIGSALPTYIGQNLGAKDIDRAKKSYWTSMKIVLILSIIVIALGYLTAEYVVMLFAKSSSEELIKLSLEYAYFSITTAFFMGWFNCLCGVYDGSTNTKISMILSISRLLVIRMPIVYLLRAFTNLAYTGIWVSMIISNLIVCIIGQILYFKYPWENRGYDI